ncbi:hypothetical protein OnM2_079016 [Erysiphe neolycopersici]|uniref:Uncharacterized protein n=1 Tax=Erysiphe neolycopersici TaxID=212602 RepID=A0A420HGX4_9PEZI|nr:hypothetical protein OnM2_079016 [Erysiphe neolycopersici]
MIKLKKYLDGVYRHVGGLTSFSARYVVSMTPKRYYPRKDSQDRESMDPTPTEYSKSGTDSSVAEGKDAFNPAVTKPEEMKKIAGQGIEGNPLEVSPANTELSKSTERTEGEKQRSEKVWSG